MKTSKSNSVGNSSKNVMQHAGLALRPKLAQKLKSIITQSYDIQIGNFKSLNPSTQDNLQLLIRTQSPIPAASYINNLGKKIGNYFKKRRLGH